ncbi:uncharacterized protein LOC126837477 [Adelges cooleyi]|uniref:uncharacterized protein LOC126837477 n=1 Tax=Adelges cooleyi TaxID=133065 RepID=UPI00217F8941|nr:uncharacterized protein LOC126837477 [Adelges cooleyi]
MVFKFTILILSCIMVDNCLSDLSDKEVIENAFNLAYDYFDLKQLAGGFVTHKKYLKQFDFFIFMGKHDDLQCIKNYWVARPDLPKSKIQIDLKEFTEVVYCICKARHFVVKKFVDEMVAAAEVVKEAFVFVYQYYNVETRHATQSDILNFLGNDDKTVHCVNEYWTVNLVSQKKQDMIYLEQFAGIVYRICAERQLAVNKFLEDRIAAAKLIRDAYRLAYARYDTRDGDDRLSRSDLLDFVGKDDGNSTCVNDNWPAESAPQETDSTEFKKFTNVVYCVCSIQKVDLVDFLRGRMEILD